MKKLLSLILTISVLISAMSVSVSASTLPSAWARVEVNNAENTGIITDKVKKNYQKDITREEFCELIVKLYEKLTDEVLEVSQNIFVDTNNQEVLKAYDLGIVKGISANQFVPNKNITRQEICVMIVRCIDAAFESEDITKFNDNNFTDKYKISNWAIDCVNYAYDNGIMRGVGNNRINPLDNVTCEQAILLAYRIYSKYEQYDIVDNVDYEENYNEAWDDELANNEPELQPDIDNNNVDDEDDVSNNTNNEILPSQETNMKVTVDAIEVMSYPTKTIYLVGEDGTLFDPSGLVLKLTFSDGSKQILSKFPQRLINEGEKKVIYDFDGMRVSIPIETIKAQIDEYNGHKYMFFDRVANYKEAKKFCEDMGGYLATISSNGENDFLFRLMKSYGYDGAYFGFTDAEVEGTWKWVNGEKTGYTNWHPGEPNAENENEDYAMFYYKFNDGTWNDGDFGGDTVNGGTVFICEWN